MKASETVMSPEQAKEFLYRVSTSPKPFAFTNEDGTLIPPDTYSHVRLKEALERQAEISFKAGQDRRDSEWCAAISNATGLSFVYDPSDMENSIKRIIRIGDCRREG